MESAWPGPSTSGFVQTTEPHTLYDMHNMSGYEFHQRNILSKKILPVQREMLKPDNLVHLYKCTGRFCSFSTDAPERAHSHWTEHNALAVNSTNSCAYCQYFYPSRYVSELVHHIAWNHGQMSFCCSRCLYRAATGHSVEEHTQRVHGVIPNHASVLQAIVHTNKIADDNNYTAAKMVNKYVCPHLRDSFGYLVRCGFESAFLEPTLEHLKKHPNQKHPCLYCETPPFNTSEEWAQHLKSHGFDWLVCAYCGLGVNNSARMLNHFSRIHPDRKLRVYSRQTSPISLVSITANPHGTVRVVCRENMDADTKDPRHEAQRAHEFEIYCQDLHDRGLRSKYERAIASGLRL